MAAQVQAAVNSAMAKAYGWQIECQELTAYVYLRPRRRPELCFLLRVAFDDFPRHAPSYVFVDSKTKELSDAAWPPNVKHGQPPPGICTPGTREFHEHWHKDDAQGRWDSERYSFLDTLQRIQRLVEDGIGG